MTTYKNICKKIGQVLEYVIGIAFALCLFLGGLGFVGYLVAFCIGGETATTICTWIFETYYAFLIKVGTVSTLLTFLSVYLVGGADWVNPITYWKNRRRQQKNPS